MLPEEIAKFTDRDATIRIFEVEKGAIKKFADAVDDRNPLYWDEEYARNSRYGSIIAPPGFFGWPTTWEGVNAVFSELEEEARAAAAQAGYTCPLDGGVEYEFFRPVRAGDTLTASTVMKDIAERGGKSGKMIFMVVETTYTAQDGSLVAKARHTSIHR